MIDFERLLSINGACGLYIDGSRVMGIVDSLLIVKELLPAGRTAVLVH